MQIGCLGWGTRSLPNGERYRQTQVGILFVEHQTLVYHALQKRLHLLRPVGGEFFGNLTQTLGRVAESVDIGRNTGKPVPNGILVRETLVDQDKLPPFAEHQCWFATCSSLHDGIISVPLTQIFFHRSP